MNSLKSFSEHILSDFSKWINEEKTEQSTQNYSILDQEITCVFLKTLVYRAPSPPYILIAPVIHKGTKIDSNIRECIDSILKADPSSLKSRKFTNFVTDGQNQKKFRVMTFSSTDMLNHVLKINEEDINKQLNHQ